MTTRSTVTVFDTHKIKVIERPELDSCLIHLYVKIIESFLWPDINKIKSHLR